MKFIENLMNDLKTVTPEEILEASKHLEPRHSDGDSVGTLSIELQKLYVLAFRSIKETRRLELDATERFDKSLSALKESLIANTTKHATEDILEIFARANEMQNLHTQAKKLTDKVNTCETFFWIAVSEEFNLLGQDGVELCTGWEVFVPKRCKNCGERHKPEEKKHLFDYPDIGLAN